MNLKRTKGPLIVAFTGPDGTGKSTQVQTLEQYARREGLRVTVHHQYEPVSAPVRWMKERFRRIGSEAQARVVVAGTAIEPALPDARGGNDNLGKLLVMRLLGAWWLISGWWRQAIRCTRAEGDMVILDRCYIDEVVRASWKTRATESLAWTLFRRVPRPDLVLWLDVDEDVAWERKKAKNSTRTAYSEKRRVIDTVMERAAELWPVQKIDVADHDAAEVARQIRSLVDARRAMPA